MRQHSSEDTQHNHHILFTQPSHSPFWPTMLHIDTRRSSAKTKKSVLTFKQLPHSPFYAYGNTRRKKHTTIQHSLSHTTFTLTILAHKVEDTHQQNTHIQQQGCTPDAAAQCSDDTRQHSHTIHTSLTILAHNVAHGIDTREWGAREDTHQQNTRIVHDT